MSTITFGPGSYGGTVRTPVRTPARGTARNTARTASRPAAAHVRLTRRGKIVIVSIAVAVIGLLAVVLGPSSTATDEIGTPPATTTVRVLPGHTLWQIAAQANPKGDIRATVDQIVELNALPNASALQLGSEIAVPVYDK